MKNREIVRELESLYKKFSESGIMTHYGLCNVIRYQALGYNVTEEFRYAMSPKGITTPFWGYGERYKNSTDIYFKFTPLRQNLLLLFIEYLKCNECGLY